MKSEINLENLLVPLSAPEFLEEMSADTPGLYLLGSVNRHITVYSQQCRAINLIDALMGDGLDGKSVAIVGAGFAGLTATAYALRESTARVTLFDAAPRPLWLQDRCKNRWLHPGIYDWPFPGSLEPCTALPMLNWRAGAAADVANQIRAEWERIAASKGLLKLRLKTEVTAVACDGDGRMLVNLAGGEQEPFDIVVLAVGFGIERDGLGRAAYWNDADGLDGIVEGSSVLVAGFGDGGLADVLRLCLPDVRQDSLIELVRLVSAETRRELIAKEEGLRWNSEALNKFYSELRSEPVIKRLMNAPPPLARVTFAGKGRLYDPRSAILNRFLVSQLRQARGEKVFELVEGPVDTTSLKESPNGRWRIKFEDAGEEREFDHVVLRLGPEAVYQRTLSPSDLKTLEERRKIWLKLPQSLDRTRVPHPKEQGAHIVREDRLQDFLAYESSSRRWCVVLSPPHASVDLASYARLALRKESDHIVNLNDQPLPLCSKDAFADQTTIRSAVRALCAADIVVADVTGYDPCLLLLLGIRAAVRRGVTIACTKQSDPWHELPFNLKELNPISFHDEVKGYGELRAALRAGLAQSGISTSYLDLPVYDYVREIEADKATEDRRRVLFLRAFTSYDIARKLHVQERIRGGLGLHENARVESVIDQTSPRLAGQRLYEAIRHWEICVVDLTWWRANVMFELGVSLAVRPSGTFCLIDTTVEGDGTFKGSRAELKDFLHPFSYDMDTLNFSEAFASLGPNQNIVYDTASRHFRTAQDNYNEKVDALLIAAAAVTTDNGDPLQSVDINALYARRNPIYVEEIRHSVFERLCGAWYYLVAREEPHRLHPIDLLDRSRAEAFRRFCWLGALLKTGLAHRYEPRDERMRRYIEEVEKSAMDSGAWDMAERLDAWMQFRLDPPWRWKINTGKDSRLEYINECEDHLRQLSELEDLLVQLKSPVCELPLQEVRSDWRRSKIILDRLNGETND